jgi:putative endonuclease
MKFFVYIIFSDDSKKFYTGITNDLNKRIKEHNRGRCTSTKSSNSWNCVFTKEFDTRIDAHNLEIKIKKRGAKRFLDDLKAVVPT